MSAACVTLALAGCGTPTSEVSGKVTYHGQAITGGSVMLFDSKNQMVAGLIGPDGAYRIPNVGPGPVQVAVRSHPHTPPGFQLKQNVPYSPDAPAPYGPNPSVQARERPIPDKYGMPDKSGLTLVVSQPTQTFDINLQ